MNINTFDIVLLFILAISVSLIIGFNVMFIVNKKLSNIRINIPSCPKPNVYIKSEGGYLTKIEVDNVRRDETRQIIENFNNTNEQMKDNTKKTDDSMINVNKSNYPICMLNVVMNNDNNYRTGYISANGDIINQDVNTFIPKIYMGGMEPQGVRGVSYANKNIEKPADIDQIGSIPINDYNGQPKPTFGI